MVYVHDDMAMCLYTETEFRIFTDKSITPFLFFQDVSSEETHGSIHDDSIGRISDDHALFVKEVELIGHDFLEIGSMFYVVCLRTLYGCYFFVCKESERHLEPIGLYAIIRIDKSYDFCTRIGEFECFIECARFVSFEGVKVVKTDMRFSEALNKSFYRLPY